jgi:hypothetical protein
MSETIRVFVATSPNGQDAESCMVLDYSIRKYASRPVHVEFMYKGSHPETTGWRTDKWATPFTCFRWCVPELAGHQGKAIYMDSDIFVLRDIAELYDLEVPDGKWCLGKMAQRLCVSLWDCERAVWKLDKKDPNFHRLMSAKVSDKIGLLPAHWNVLDREKHIPLHHAGAYHFTNMRAQCHLERAHARLGGKHWIQGRVPHIRPEAQAMFDTLYEEALASGFRLEDYGA